MAHHHHTRESPALCLFQKALLLLEKNCMHVTSCLMTSLNIKLAKCLTGFSRPQEQQFLDGKPSPWRNRKLFGCDVCSLLSLLCPPSGMCFRFEPMIPCGQNACQRDLAFGSFLTGLDIWTFSAVKIIEPECNCLGSCCTAALSRCIVARLARFCQVHGPLWHG